MKTRITELLACRYPVLLSGMTGISNPELVAAVSNAGGLGILATADLNDAQTRKAVRRVRDLTDQPFGANVALLLPGSAKKAGILSEEKVPVVNFSLGKDERLIQDVHSYGGRVIITVTNEKHALSAEKSGADAVIATGHEAAAHGGPVASMVLIPCIRRTVDIPVVAAGGISGGRGLAAALALGADGVAMGTRFMNTAESPAHTNMKMMSNQKGADETVYSDRLDGLPCRAIDSPGAARLMRDPLYLVKALYNSRYAARTYGFPWIKAMAGILLAGFSRSRQLARMSNAYRAVTAAIEEGDHDRGLFLMGQVTGLIRETLPVARVMETVVAEAREAQLSLAEQLDE